ncbi:MAG: DUF3800 domain-containing protein [Bacteroidales bacterium]|nr:DUF3800 domain-containing protein [Bacteroidales bacterium]
MKKIRKRIRKRIIVNYYIDESGTPEFYGRKNKLLVGKDGYSPILIIGLVSILNRKKAYQQIEDFKKSILLDNNLKDVYTLHQPGWFLHAKDDHPKVRELFFDFLTTLNFQGYFIVGRKKLDVFEKRHLKSEKNFYFDLIQNLLKGRFKKGI